VAFDRVSGQNCANIYNHSFATPCPVKPETWPHKFTLSSPAVWHAFQYNAILRDCAERDVQLVLQDVGNQDERLKSAMEQRNKHILKQGQRERMHACKTCERFLPGSGYMGLREHYVSADSTLFNIN
jgi:hypothetical protein